MDYMNNFMKDYYNQFLFGNGTVVQLAATDFINYMIMHFEERAMHVSNFSELSIGLSFLEKQAYQYIGLSDQGLMGILKGLVSTSLFMPQPTSSLVIEFFEKDPNATSFNRTNYYVNVTLDDEPLAPYFKAMNVACKTPTTCQWDSLYAYLK